MMGPMGTLLGVLAGELWLVAGEDTGDDSLLSEDPMEREHRSSGATSPPCCPLYPHSAIPELSLELTPQGGQAGKDPVTPATQYGPLRPRRVESRGQVWSAARSP